MVKIPCCKDVNQWLCATYDRLWSGTWKDATRRIMKKKAIGFSEGKDEHIIEKKVVLKMVVHVTFRCFMHF